jgi:hypothetical protein
MNIISNWSLNSCNIIVLISICFHILINIDIVLVTLYKPSRKSLWENIGDWIRIAHLFSSLWVFSVLTGEFCLVCLDFPFLLTSSIFPSVYLIDISSSFGSYVPSLFLFYDEVYISKVMYKRETAIQASFVNYVWLNFMCKNSLKIPKGQSISCSITFISLFFNLTK